VIERQKVSPKFDYDVHQALKVLAEIDGLSMERWCERAVTREVKSRIHAASVVAEMAKELKIDLRVTGSWREQTGSASPTDFGDTQT
jgi:hypothetical protein